MKEKDLPIDLTKHQVYSKNAKKCVLKLADIPNLNYFKHWMGVLEFRGVMYSL